MGQINSRKFSKNRILFLLLVLGLSGVGAYFTGDALRLSEKPSEYIGLVFSILAASLFAVVSIVGDPGMLASGPTKEAWVNARELRRELAQFNALFVWYLITLALLVISEVVEHAKIECLFWTFHVFAFCSISGFILSLALPFEFSRIQKRRLEQEIDSRHSRPSKVQNDK